MYTQMRSVQIIICHADLYYNEKVLTANQKPGQVRQTMPFFYFLFLVFLFVKFASFDIEIDGKSINRTWTVSSAPTTGVRSKALNLW